MIVRVSQAHLTGRIIITLMSDQIARNPTRPTGRILAYIIRAREVRVSRLTTHSDQPRVSSPINLNYCVNELKAGQLTGSRETVKCVQLPETPSVTRRQ